MNTEFGTFPLWLTAFAALSLVLGIVCAVVVAIDVIRRPQKMTVMAFVWPISMLFGGLLWLAGYFRWGRTRRRGDERRTPMAVSVATGTNHCGAGCALGDLVAEWTAFLLPAVAVAFGWGWLFQDKMFAVWVLDFILAFGIGIIFQYFAIAPMRGLSLREGLKEALKADAASISAWQIGMYGTMALLQFLVLPAFFGGRAPVNSPEFWFAMQWAMLVGFATSYPVNWLLIRTGVKERM
ncbi:DUF4396 domain-containing protein [uncultured Leifsonia sp.]|uniref:DUF4396 domain-containing protein n=1 Tax=uncultured Leifsonia sp. TaxID=340359 RepID=UPI0025E1838F|nr:DUF4396 domain-containing protein [uncultured Leifsonia sp.]